MLKGHCQDPRCNTKFKKQPVSLYYHSTELYYHSLFKKTGEKMYKACKKCILEDHEKWDSRDAYKYRSYKKIKPLL